MGLITWIKELMSSRRSSFSMFQETLDPGLYYNVRLRYCWRANPASLQPLPRMPDALARHVLGRTVSGTAARYRLFQHRSAQDAINADLCQDITDAENRIFISASARVLVPRDQQRAMRRRTTEENALRAVFARETVELQLLLCRLTDPTLGPVWWMNHYADLQFAAGDPAAKATSIVNAFKTLRQTLADDGRDTEPKARLRRTMAEIVADVENPDALMLAMDLLQRTLQQTGFARHKAQEQ